MSKKGVLILSVLLVLIMIPVSLGAYEKKVYSGSVLYLEDLWINYTEGQFRVSLGSSNKLTVTLPDGFGMILINNTCEKKDDFTVCFNNLRYDHHNATLDKDINRASFNISESRPSPAWITIRQSIDIPELNIGQSARIEVTLENTGDLSAQNTLYSVIFPDFFDITPYGPSVNLQDGSYLVKWRGEVKPGEKRSFSYRIVPKSNITLESKARLSYDDGEKKAEMNSQVMKITVLPHQLALVLSPQNGSVGLGDSFIFSVWMKNLAQRSIDIDTRIDVPDSLKILEKDKRLLNLGWKGKLGPQESVNLTLNLSSTRIGNFSVFVGTSYVLDSIETHFESSSVIRPYCAPLLLEYDITDNIGSISIPIRIRNIGSCGYNNVSLSVSSDIPGFSGFEKHIGTLPARMHDSIDDIRIMTPEGDFSADMGLGMLLAYQTSFGQQFEMSKEIDLGVVSDSGQALHEDPEDEGDFSFFDFRFNKDYLMISVVTFVIAAFIMLHFYYRKDLTEP
ncbi:hypothetical protein JW968_07060 [Candidatus Woesearchaeota archaeon]|nr:hypothetical protein [Candidatus Woesearchaeota archaeon]